MRTKQTMDGNTAAAHVSYAYSDVAAIYPITPSSPMAEVTEEWSAKGRENIFGHPVKVSQLQSEAGAAGAVHGALVAGALATTFTASQGLLLMIPNLYKIAGELLPGVFNVAARAVATHALSIFGDHSDVYACRQTGAAMFATSSVQEVMDLTPVAHLVAIEGRIPFINFFDGFRTSHEFQKIEVWDYADLKEMLNEKSVQDFRKGALNPEHAYLMGSAQNPDVFFQAREACNNFYDALPQVVEKYINKINDKLGTSYGLFDYYGAQDADHVIIAMGSVCETIAETIDYLNSQGKKYGLLKVHLYRPFSIEHFINKLPKTVKQLSVLDRTKEPGAIGEPLYLDVIAALKGSGFENVKVYSGRYGLGSKDTTPEQIMAVYENDSKPRFTIGINDDVTGLSLDNSKFSYIPPKDIICCKFWGLGADGTVSGNKNSIKIIGEHTDKYVQAYFEYDSKKSGGITMSHLRFGDSPIRSTYLINQADFVACHNQTYILKYDMVQEVRKGGTFLLNCQWSKEELNEKLPGQVKRYIAENDINFYIINGLKVGKEIGLNSKINTILQSAFFKLAGIIPYEEAVEYMKAAAKKSYGFKGEKIIEMNYKAIDRGGEAVVKVNVPDEWKNCKDEGIGSKALEDRTQVMHFVEQIQNTVNSQKGNTLPVSAFLDYADGSTPSGTTAHERRNIAVDIPEWIPENCIQCNRCSYVCPHAVIRPAVLTEADKDKVLKSKPMLGMPDKHFSIVISAVDCTGCGSCAGVCPGMKGNKALVMKLATDEAKEKEQAGFDYAKPLLTNAEAVEKFKENTVKGSQFKRPLMEFSGACAGCGETPYVKLITQLFGERMYIANATGCSSIWGNSFPATPYTATECGKGPAWGNSLFEDAAEFGYGMRLAQIAIREGLKNELEELIKKDVAGQDVKLKEAVTKWLETYTNGNDNAPATEGLIAALKNSNSESARNILDKKDFLSKKSQWIFGGDGWAYDIGFGGLDHVIASGEDINILVMDTEVYSNTGGQASKATPAGAVAKFALNGKRSTKKDLASIAMSYGNVYVAQIAMGADYNQTIKAITEAENYNGPSIIIAYAPCVSHGIRAGMGCTQAEQAKAVDSGYWHLFRYNPKLAANGEAAFILDSKEPKISYQEFLEGEIRYDSLKKREPEQAKELFDRAEAAAKRRYEYLKKLVILYGNDTDRM